jgi:hypothetical protein
MAGWQEALMTYGPAVAGFAAGEVAKGNARGAAAQLTAEQQALIDSIQDPVLKDLMVERITSSHQLNPQLQSAQMEAMQHMQGIGRAGGMDAQFRGSLEEASMQAAQQERGQREAALSRVHQQYGAGGGMPAMVAQMQAGQDSANRNRMAGVAAASAASQRAMQAMAASGQMAGQLRTADLGEAQARDAIAQFNSGQSLKAQQANNANQLGGFSAQLQKANARNGLSSPKTALDEGDAQAEAYNKMGQFGSQAAANYYKKDKK